MSKIKKINAREILDSRGNPTVEVDVITTNDLVGRAAVPSGASTGAHEACELRDGDKKRYLGKGVLNAMANVKKIEAALLDQSVFDQVTLDKKMIELDGTANKTNLGANAILGVSLASAKAAALENKKYIFENVNLSKKTYKLPVPLMNVINGGAHANNGLNVQEFMLVPLVQNSFKESLRAGSEIFHTLKKILAEKGLSTAVGDEGGFAPKLDGNQQALELLMTAIEKTGYIPGKDIYLALDVAATEFFHDNKYSWENKKLSSEELTEVYSNWKKKFPLISIEDGFSEDDWSGWSHATQKLGNELQLVGDDLFVTNPKRLQRGIQEKVANALLVKVNQIGTLTETAQAVQLAQSNQYATVMSHRSGETEDSIIADLSVRLSCQQIKTGSLCRSERTAKYNQLLRIEEYLGSNCSYWGTQAFRRV